MRQRGSAPYGNWRYLVRYTPRLTLLRQPWFYMWSIVFPLVLVTFFGHHLFFSWDESTLTDTRGPDVDLSLTVTAESLVVSGDLPKISYFTLIDYAFCSPMRCCLVVAVESLLVTVNRQVNVWATRSVRVLSSQKITCDGKEGHQHEREDNAPHVKPWLAQQGQLGGVAGNRYRRCHRERKPRWP